MPSRYLVPWLCLLVVSIPNAAPITVATASGPLTGTDTDGVRVFRGIPYAAPPVGVLRWRPSQPPQSWTAPRDCTKFGPACPQAADRIVTKVGAQSEDCLYLNVFAPEGEKQPVMVWIHGGGFSKGAASVPIYDSPDLARQGVVLVTINYRLGHFGFFCHPALTAESPEKTCGNYGLLDQIAALQWVRNNIERFGGDPGNVTIFGESAGAVSVSLHMVSPLSRGLFHRAIMQSGTVPMRMKARADLERQGQEMQRKLGIADGPGALAALREVKPERLLASGAGDDMFPGMGTRDRLCLGGYGLPEAPAEVFAAGRQAPVPVIVGSTADEGTLWSRKLPVKTVAAYQAMLRAMFQEHAAEMTRLYPVQTDADVERALDEIVGEGFVAGARRVARWTEALGQPAYLYQFTRENALSKRCGLGAFHGSELVYLFHTFPMLLRPTPDDEGLSRQMMAYWASFARTGNPNGAGAYPWPSYTTQADRHLVLDAPPGQGQHLRQAQCDLWDTLQRLQAAAGL